jgi:hypothetical protein
MKSALLMIALVTTLAGCGGESGGSCADGPACGGEIAPGRYRATCVSLTGKMTWRQCAEGISILSSNLTTSGTYTFNADKTFQVDVTWSGSITQKIPAGCSLDGPRLPCAQLGPAISRPGSSVSCTGTDACTCTTTVSDHETGSGLYQTTGTSLFRQLSGSSPSLTDYCATPTTLTLTRDNDVGDVTGPMDSTFRTVRTFVKE